MTRDKHQEVASKLATAVNCFFSEKRAAEYLSREHRTLQQTFTKVCVEWLKVLANTPENCYDDRNAASVRFAKELMSIPEVKALLDNTSLPLI